MQYIWAQSENECRIHRKQDGDQAGAGAAWAQSTLKRLCSAVSDGAVPILIRRLFYQEMD
jgi:hypothetical protein